MSVYAAMQEERFLPVAELDEGFLRPTYEQQVIVSYMQAGLVCMFIDRQYGVAALRELLQKFREGLLTGAAIAAVLDIRPDEFDVDFEQFVRAEHGAILDNLEDWQRSQLSMQKKMSDGDWPGAIEQAGHMLELLPQYVEPNSPYLVLAQAREELGERPQAIEVLEDFWRRGGYDPAALGRLALWLAEAERIDDAIAVMQSINLVDPLDQALHGRLGDLLLERGRAEEALLEYSIALSLDPHDKATAYYRVANAYHELGNAEQAEDHLLQALDVAPNFRPAQRLLLDVMRDEPNNQH